MLHSFALLHFSINLHAKAPTASVQKSCQLTFVSCLDVMAFPIGTCTWCKKDLFFRNVLFALSNLWYQFWKSESRAPFLCSKRTKGKYKSENWKAQLTFVLCLVLIHLTIIYLRISVHNFHKFVAQTTCDVLCYCSHQLNWHVNWRWTITNHRLLGKLFHCQTSCN